MAKYFERWPHLVQGKRCIELGAGCGLVGIVCGCLGARDVLLTDMPENLSLLQQNIVQNSQEEVSSVKTLMWGANVDDLHPPFDIVLATDVLYDHASITPLVNTLCALSDSSSVIYIAYGRNRWAESSFIEQIKGRLDCQIVAECDLDATFQCVDVDLYRLKKVLYITLPFFLAKVSNCICFQHTMRANERRPD
eukprot:jgi/Mesen1/4546/ME000232S03809